MNLNRTVALSSLAAPLNRLFELAAKKTRALESSWDQSKGTPVFTVGGKYTTRGWTEWTQGFQYGMAILQFDAVRDAAFLELGRKRTVERMAAHVWRLGVHDKGLNKISAYGIWGRWRRGGAIAFEGGGREMDFYEL